MPNITKVTSKDLNVAAMQTAVAIANGYSAHEHVIPVYPIPRGGVPAFYLVQVAMMQLKANGDDYVELEQTHIEDEAYVFIDDLIDSGTTRDKYAANHPGASFFTLFDKQTDPAITGLWLQFPWEQTAEKEMEENVIRLLEFVGEDPTRSGLLETPKRVIKALKEKTSGYGANAGAILKTFEDGAEGCDEMVMVKDIPFHSMCEHHMETISGTASIAYIPDGKIVGLSKLARLLDSHAHRLQVQERLTNDITSDLMQHLKPIGAACLITATHGCMECRGIKKQGSVTVTSSLKGAFKTQPETRAEFMALANSPK